MLSILCVRLTIKVKVGIPESFKVGWYPLKKTGSSHLKAKQGFSFSAKSESIISRLSLIKFKKRKNWHFLAKSMG